MLLDLLIGSTKKRFRIKYMSKARNARALDPLQTGETMDLISVIIPVYKAERYIDLCIASIVRQTYENLEIILVDDESPDLCPQICDAWQRKDSRIKVIHTKNGGSARARNIGLQEAKGAYIAFSDADDLMHPSMLEDLYRVAVREHAEIVECGYATNERDIFCQNDHRGTVEVFDPQTALSANIDDKVFRQLVWNKLYAASVLKGIWFVEGKTIDDEFWTYRVIAKAKKLAKIDRKLYFYRQQEESVMHQPYSVKRLEAVEAHVERHKLIVEKYPELSKKSLISLWLDCRYHGQMAEKYLTNEDKTKTYAYLKPVLKKYPLRFAYIAGQPFQEKVWLLSERIALPLTCIIRNVLNIGF